MNANVPRPGNEGVRAEVFGPSSRPARPLLTVHLARRGAPSTGTHRDAVLLYRLVAP